jgi:hypothetical protein
MNIALSGSFVEKSEIQWVTSNSGNEGMYVVRKFVRRTL